MPKNSLPDERDRAIAGIVSVETPPLGEDPVIEQGEMTENDDGSIDYTLDEDEGSTISSHYENLAEVLDATELSTLSSDLLELIDRDKEARKKRDEQYEEGLKRTGLGNEAPGGASFTGASKVVHPVMAEACIDFAARTIKELVPAKGPVKTRINGKVTKDAIERARRKRDFLNWQLANKITEYRSEKEQLLTQLPLGGSQYEKYWYDEIEGRIKMEFVPVDKVLLPFSASSFYTAPRATHMIELTQAQVEERVKSGFYVAPKSLITGQEPETTAAGKSSDKIEGREATGYNEDGLRIVYEVSCCWVIENDELAPYVVHIDEPTGDILAIYRNWKEGDERKAALDWWTEDIFIPWRGAYGIGLPHLVGGLSGSATGALRALLDSAHINNMPSMLKLKTGRVVGQNKNVDATQIIEIDGAPGLGIRDTAMPMPYNPPSPVLFQLLGWLTDAAKGVITTSEEKIADATSQMPVGTTLALIEQGSQVYSAIHGRLHDAQRRSLKIICRLNYDYPNEEDFARFDVTREDFADNDDIEPVSDPNIFSEAQRYAQLQEEFKVMALFPELGWKRHALARQALDLLRVDDIDAKLPPEPEEITGSPVVENAAAAKGVPLKIDEGQDHMAHMTAHLGWILSVFGAANQLTSPQALATVLGHVQDHFSAFYLQQVEAQISNIRSEGFYEGSDDELQAIAQEHVIGMMTANPTLLQQIQQAIQAVQSRQPPPQLPPEVQASIQIAQMENKRKSDLDQATLAMKGAQQQAANAMEAQRLQLDAMQQQFDQRMEQLRQFMEQQAQAQAQQIELLKNREDNQQHQITELLKNRDDNQTQLLIERIRGELASMQQASSESAQGEQKVAENAQMLQLMQRVLDEMGNSKTHEALTNVLGSLNGVMERMSRPRVATLSDGTQVKIE